MNQDGRKSIESAVIVQDPRLIDKLTYTYGDFGVVATGVPFKLFVRVIDYL